MLLQTYLGRRDQPVGNGRQPDVAAAMPAPIDRDGFQANVDGSEMRAGRNVSPR